MTQQWVKKFEKSEKKKFGKLHYFAYLKSAQLNLF